MIQNENTMECEAIHRYPQDTTRYNVAFGTEEQCVSSVPQDSHIWNLKKKLKNISSHYGIYNRKKIPELKIQFYFKYL